MNFATSMLIAAVLAAGAVGCATDGYGYHHRGGYDRHDGHSDRGDHDHGHGDYNGPHDHGDHDGPR